MDHKNSTMTIIHSVPAQSEWDKQLFYYISDLHPEQQLLCVEKTASDIRATIKKKIAEMFTPDIDITAPLLIAGDTGDSFEISSWIYEVLLSCWEGNIFVVLGNHELWDCEHGANRAINEIIAEYKAFEKGHPRIHILENELIICKRNSNFLVLSEKQVLAMDPTTFWKLYGSSHYMILGGIGFTGLNPVINAQEGIYRDKLTAEEDIERSARFNRIHERLRVCAGAFRAIILTHTPPQDWCSNKLCDNWFYVCGHNHQNNFNCSSNRPVILNDNQMGFIPRKWALKAFTFNPYNEYNPLEHLSEGIHQISSDEYINYLRSSGIGIQNFSRKGTIYAIKHDDAYMFLLEGKKLYILNGGSIHVAEHPLAYYNEHLTRYISQVRKAFIPYDREKKRLGKVIRKLGGWGSDHGCIVDIDFWNHIYCDPCDGTISFYYATDIVNKVFYPDFSHLLKESPSLPCRDLLLKRLESMGNFPTLLPTVNESALLSMAPEIVRDTSMYDPSRKMRAVQYVLEQKVVRFWRDEILEFDFDSMQINGISDGNKKLLNPKNQISDEE